MRASAVTDADITNALNEELARIRREVPHAEWPAAVSAAYQLAGELRAMMDALRGRRRHVRREWPAEAPDCEPL